MTQSIPEKKIIFDAKKEEPTELELSLPEYLPGIAKIIHVEPIFGKCDFATEGKKAFIEARASLRIVYLSDIGGKIKCAVFDESFNCPFREEFSHEGDYEAVPAVYISSMVAKPTAGRKIRLKFVLHISCKAYELRQTEIYLKDENDDSVFVLSREAEYRSVYEICQGSMSATAEIKIEKSNPAAGEIILPRVNAHSISCSCLDGVLKIKASLSLFALYDCVDDGERGENEYSVCASAFSGAELETEIEDRRITEQSLCFAYIDINSVDCSVETDSDGEGRIIVFNIGYTVNANLSENKTCSLVSDVFSSACSMLTKPKRLSLQSACVPIHFRQEVKHTLREDLSGLSEISTCFLNMLSVSRERGEGKEFAKAKCVLELLGVNAAGELISENHPVTLHIPLEECENENELFDFYITVCSCNAEIQSGVLECTFNFDINGICCKDVSLEVVGDASLLTDEPIMPRKGELIVYYPSDDEKIWDVSKKYSVQPEKLKKANKIPEDSEVFTSNVIIIP